MASQSFEFQLRSSSVVAALSGRLSELSVVVSVLESQLVSARERLAYLESRLSRLEVSGRP